jgi:D-alanyl-D-alanine carboxypeptidase (penicillin-binding protein 5/6)
LNPAALLLAAACACSAASGAGAAPPEAGVVFPGGASAYLVEVQGRPRWAHEPDRALPPASLTKLMTALLFAESGRPPDGVVTVGVAAARATGTRLQLRAGERLRAADLLAATLIASANDACLALAEHVAGDKARFVAQMNRRAKELGMTHTAFTNPCGHDEPGHRSSARDLATLARAAMQHAAIAVLAGSVERRVGTLGGRSFMLENGNELLGRYPGALGVKSGYTPRAGKCLIAFARREGVEVLLVVLNAQNRWWDSVAALDRAWAETPPAPSAGPGR